MFKPSGENWKLMMSCYMNNLFRVVVNEFFTGVVADDVFFVGFGDDVIWRNRDFSAAARSINDKGRHRVTGGMSAEFFHNVYPNGNRRAEMFGT